MSPFFFGCTGLARSYCGASELSLSRSALKPPKVDHTYIIGACGHTVEQNEEDDILRCCHIKCNTIIYYSRLSKKGIECTARIAPMTTLLITTPDAILTVANSKGATANPQLLCLVLKYILIYTQYKINEVPN